jgi:hypothetical protein
MKKFCACICFLAAAYQSPAALIFYDSFNYSASGAPQLSSAGTPAWALYAGIAGVDPRMNAGSLSYPGLDTASGDNSAIFNGTGATGLSTHNLGAIYNIGNSTTLYYSLTFQVTSISTADWGGSGNFLTGSFMMGFNQKTSGSFANGDSAAPLLIRTGDPNNTSGTANDFQGFQLGTGVTQTSPGSRVFDGAHVYAPGTTLFLVLSYTFGAGANDDVSRLYVNPVPGSLESANTPVVTATGVADVNNSQIQSFYFRNNSVEPTSTVVDDLRIGTSWEDVTPLLVPEPSVGLLSAIGFLSLIAARRMRRSGRSC